MSDPDQAAVAKIADVLARVSGELHIAAALLDDVSVPAESAVTHGMGALHPPFVRALQEIDRARQIVCGIADFIIAIARSAPNEWSLDVAPHVALLTLERLVAQLHPHGTSAARTNYEISSGDCEMF